MVLTMKYGDIKGKYGVPLSSLLLDHQEQLDLLGGELSPQDRVETLFLAGISAPTPEQTIDFLEQAAQLQPSGQLRLDIQRVLIQMRMIHGNQDLLKLIESCAACTSALREVAPESEQEGIAAFATAVELLKARATVLLMQAAWSTAG